MTSLDQLLAGFEAGEIDGANFPHESHVRVAWGLARRYPRDEAFRRLGDGIRQIAVRAGRPAAYHATITRAWFELTADAENLEQHPELFDKTLLERYYSRDRLAAGRERWLEPDLHPLRLPPPERVDLSSSLAGVLHRIPTAVAVLATHGDHTPHATTVSSLTSVSREPPLVSVCIASDSRTLDLVRTVGAFTISILTAEQGALANRFAAPDRPTGAGQFAGVPHHLSPYGPLLDTAAAWLGCELVSLHPCGDHHIAVGRVVLAEASERRPLVRHDGAYH